MTEPGATLLVLARDAIAGHFGQPPQAVPPHDPALTATLAAPGATFVTLTEDGRLRGCIGSLEAWRPLAEDVRENALAAALRDPRFSPLTAAELASVRVEVSLLSPARPLAFADEADALARLRPGIDGVIFSAGRRRSTFLPQVWEQLPEVHQFMAHLKQKAGLPADYWGSDVALAVYTVDKWKEAQS